MPALTITPLMRRLAWWQWAWLLVAVTSLAPVSYYAYQTSQNVQRDMRVQLIQRYSLWESDPNYRGTPQSWTRFAAMLLNTSQLMRRVREKHGELADKIEEDFGRDSALAQGKVIAVYLLSWGAPLALLYGAGWLYQRRKPLAVTRQSPKNRIKPIKSNLDRKDAEAPVTKDRAIRPWRR